MNRTAQVLLDEAKPLVESGRFTEAISALTKAIETKSMSADMFVEALLLRSRCYSEVAEFEKSLLDLQQAEQGPVDPAHFLVERGRLYLKQGNMPEANTAFNNARQLDPGIAIPTK